MLVVCCGLYWSWASSPLLWVLDLSTSQSGNSQPEVLFLLGTLGPRSQSDMSLLHDMRSKLVTNLPPPLKLPCSYPQTIQLKWTAIDSLPNHIPMILFPFLRSQFQINNPSLFPPPSPQKINKISLITPIKHLHIYFLFVHVRWIVSQVDLLSDQPYRPGSSFG